MVINPDRSTIAKESEMTTIWELTNGDNFSDRNVLFNIN